MNDQSSPRAPKKRGFLAEYWPWIVVPAGIFLALIGFLLWFGGGSGSSPFIYNLFG